MLASGISQASFAKENFDDRYYLAPTASYLWLDDDRISSRSGHGLSLGLGKAINENVNLEAKLTYSRFQHQSDASREDKAQWDNFGALIEAQYYFNRDVFAPYVVAGLGVLDSNVNHKNTVGITAETGAGVAYRVNDDLYVRSDVRYRYHNTFNNNPAQNNADEYNDMIVNLGLVIPLGSRSQSDMSYKEEVAKEVVPAAVVVKKAVVRGIVLKGVNFAASSSQLTDQAKATLDELANDIIDSGDKRAIEIQGHTSSDGSAQGNLALSQARAQSVVDYLSSKGVKNEMTAQGYGEERLISDESTRAGRLKNRRVEMLWK